MWLQSPGTHILRQDWLKELGVGASETPDCPAPEHCRPGGFLQGFQEAWAAWRLRVHQHADLRVASVILTTRFACPAQPHPLDVACPMALPHSAQLHSLLCFALFAFNTQTQTSQDMVLTSPDLDKELHENARWLYSAFPRCTKS